MACVNTSSQFNCHSQVHERNIYFLAAEHYCDLAAAGSYPVEGRTLSWFKLLVAYLQWSLEYYTDTL